MKKIDNKKLIINFRIREKNISPSNKKMILMWNLTINLEILENENGTTFQITKENL